MSDPSEPPRQRDLKTVEMRTSRARPRRRSVSAYLVFLTLAVLAVGALALYFVEYRPLVDERDRLQTELDDERAARADAEERAEGAQGRGDECRADLATVRQELGEARAELETIRGERDSLRSRTDRVEAEATALREATEALQARLESEIESGEVLLHEEDGRVAVAMSDSVLFGAGEAALNARGQEVLRSVARSLEGMDDRVIQVGGHTDSSGISEARREQFPTNWDLASARAVQVVRFLEEECGIDGARLVAIGYAEHRPVAPNRRAAGRRRNRRIDLVLVPR